MSQTFGLSGAGNTKNHQIVISELLYAFTHKSKTVKKYSKFKSLPEITVGNKIPDIVVYGVSKSLYTPVSIFEISINSGLKNDITKCEMLMTNDINISEAFIIDITYKKVVFYKLYRLKNDNISKLKKNSKFDLFKIDLSNII